MSRTKGAKGGSYGSGIDKKSFESLCAVMCTEQDICNYFGVSHDTLNRWCKQEYDKKTFEQVFAEKSAPGLISIRRYQFMQAKDNVTMAIWLGKQYLGQTEKIEATVEDKVELINDIPKRN